MRLRVLLPAEVIVDEQVDKIIAEAANGSFCLLPRHIDFVSALVPGILSFVSIEGREEFLAVDEGVLVKYGQTVLVSVREAVRGADLGHLLETVKKEFHDVSEKQRMARTAVARIEANFVKRFMELGEGR